MTLDSVFDAIYNKYYQRNYIIYYIKQVILNATKDHISITLFWILSHSGIWNETADSIAKEAATKGFSSNFRVPHEDLFYESRNKAALQFNSYLKTTASTKGALHFEHYSHVSKKTWFEGTSLNRKEIVVINRLRSNHYNLNESLYRDNMIESPSCSCGAIKQSINHIWMQPLQS